MCEKPPPGRLSPAPPRPSQRLCVGTVISVNHPTNERLGLCPEGRAHGPAPNPPQRNRPQTSRHPARKVTPTSRHQPARNATHPQTLGTLPGSGRPQPGRRWGGAGAPDSPFSRLSDAPAPPPRRPHPTGPSQAGAARRTPIPCLAVSGWVLAIDFGDDLHGGRHGGRRARELVRSTAPRGCHRWSSARWHRRPPPDA